MATNWYQSTVEDALSRLNSSEHGLSSNEAMKRLAQYGPNELTVERQSLWRVIIEPFANIFVGVLVVAAILSVATGHAIDAAIIIAIIVVSAVIYYVQSYSTQRVLRALSQHDAQTVSVLRDNETVRIPSEELTPGDVVRLTEGEKVPADGRLLHVDNVRADESMLTGESLPVTKHVHALTDEHPIYERANILFQGSYVVSGRALLVVTETADNTEFGHLAKLAAPTSEPSPAQQKIDSLVSKLIGIIVIVVFLAFVGALLRGMELFEALRFVMSLAVAAVPEGLPVAVTVVLVLGMRQLAKYNALARSMKAIENIGIVTAIASDKTGTLTKNKLSVQEIWSADKAVTKLPKVIQLSVNHSDGGLADPLDVALHDYVTAEDISDPKGTTLHTRFSFEQKLAMSGNVWQTGERYFAVIKGAPEHIIRHCHREGSLEYKHAETQLHHFTALGYRVIGFGVIQDLKTAPESLEKMPFSHMKFIGLVAIADELRPEAKRSIQAAARAGVSVHMITGDHAETAFAIGKQLGLVAKREQVMDCRAIESMSDKQLQKQVEDIRVFARVIPEAKHRILTILKTDNIVAMTGDGVNDVPALTNAHVGIAMGSGSQIAKESGDIVLLDDNFATIVTAIEGGRTIFDNIRRMLLFLLTTTFAGVTTIMTALIIGLPLPLVAVQILWINLVTDTIFAIPLGLEPAENDVMKRPPRPADKAILERHMIERVLLVGVAMAAVTLLSFSYFLDRYSLEYAQTIAFTTLVVAQWANALNVRSEFSSFTSRLRRYNLPLLFGALFAISLQLLVLFGPLAPALHTVPVALSEIALSCAVVVAVVLGVGEAHKRYWRARLHRDV